MENIFPSTLEAFFREKRLEKLSKVSETLEYSSSRVEERGDRREKIEKNWSKR